MKELHILKDMYCRELKKYAEKGRVSMGDLAEVHELTDTIKNILKILMLEEEEGYSKDGGYGHDGGYGENSYGYGGRWEANGRYGMDSGGYSGRHYVRGHYSRDDGKKKIVEELEDMMQNANGQKREAMQRVVDMLKRE